MEKVIMLINYTSDDATYMFGDHEISNAEFCADQQELHEEKYGDLPDDWFDVTYPKLIKDHLISLGVTHICDSERNPEVYDALLENPETELESLPHFPISEW